MRCAVVLLCWLACWQGRWRWRWRNYRERHYDIKMTSSKHSSAGYAEATRDFSPDPMEAFSKCHLGNRRHVTPQGGPGEGWCAFWSQPSSGTPATMALRWTGSRGPQQKRERPSPKEAFKVLPVRHGGSQLLVGSSGGHCAVRSQ